MPDRLAEHGLLLRDGGDRLTVAGALYLIPDPAERLGKTFIEILRFPADGASYDRRLEIQARSIASCSGRSPRL